MSMVSLSITHAGGVRELIAYQVEPQGRSWARTLEAVPERFSVHGIRAWGDGLENPSAVVVRASVPAATLPAAIALAYDIVRESGSATAVVTHQGARSVAGLLGFDMRPDGADVVSLSLRFAPRSP